MAVLKDHNFEKLNVPSRLIKLFSHPARATTFSFSCCCRRFMRAVVYNCYSENGIIVVKNAFMPLVALFGRKVCEVYYFSGASGVDSCKIGESFIWETDEEIRGCTRSISNVRSPQPKSIEKFKLQVSEERKNVPHLELSTFVFWYF